jgi:NAD(P)-dependent dehydrogenase (short-subunit alcohol dehydrogenase family)
VSALTALVTGGAGGIGAAIAARAAAAGYRVCVVDQHAERAREVAARLPGAVGMACDVTDEASVERVLDAFGRVPDLLANNAGIGIFGPLMDYAAADFRRVIDVDLVGCFIVARAVARRMAQRGSGSIVNITSIASIVPNTGAGAYAAAKAGLARMTEQMAIEWGPLGLRVNAVAPGFIDAGLSSQFFADPKVREMRGSAVPTRRLGRAEDVADAVLFLASDAASYISGHELVVDGGVVSSLLTQLPRVAPAR